MAPFTDPNTTPDALDEVAGTAHFRLRARIGRNRGTTPAILTALAGDCEPIVREAVAGNPNTPAAALASLVGDISAAVREAVAANPNTTADTLVSLATDADFDVVHTVAAREPRPPWTAHRPSYVRTANEHLYQTIAAASANPALFNGLAPTWARSVDELLATVADVGAQPI